MKIRFIFLLIAAAGLITLPADADEIDQSCTSFLGGSGYDQIMSAMPCGQSFVPTASEHVGLDLFLNVMNPAQPSTPVTFVLREGDIYGPVVPGTEVMLTPDVVDVIGGWVFIVFPAPAFLAPAVTYVVEASTATARWGWVASHDDPYPPGGKYLHGEYNSADFLFRTWVATPYAIWSELLCEPDSGVVPFVVVFNATLGHGSYNDLRRLAGRVDVTVASGSHYSNWRSGYANVSAAEPLLAHWNQAFPALGSLIGQNVFHLEAEDVTPSPWNQPPYPPAGDTDTAACTVTGIAP